MIREFKEWLIQEKQYTWKSEPRSSKKQEDKKEEKTEEKGKFDWKKDRKERMLPSGKGEK